ncbi:MAG: hypothetical protein HY722_05775 [Planctomycetes bacterium]|nr:hypothetical protein [Planctomycetota bacterium]
MGQDGIALILAVMVLVLLFVVIVQFDYSSRVELRMARNAAADAQDLVAARGAIPLTHAFLRGYAESSQGVFSFRKEDFDRVVGDDPGDASLGLVPRVGKEEDETGGAPPRPSPTPAGAGGTGSGEPLPPAETYAVEVKDRKLGITIRLMEENGRIPLQNLLSEVRREETLRWVRNLVDHLRESDELYRKNLSEDFARTVAEALGIDPAVLGAPTGGAEATPVTQPATGLGDLTRLGAGRTDPFLSVEEFVRLGNGDLEVEPEDLKLLLDGGKGPEGDLPREKPLVGLRDLMTIWGEGSEGRVNINTAAGHVLYALMPETRRVPDPANPGQERVEVVAPQARLEQAQEVLKYRKDHTYKAAADLLSTPKCEGLWKADPSPASPSGEAGAPTPAPTPVTNPAQGPARRALKDSLGADSRDFTAEVEVQGEGPTRLYRGVFRVYDNDVATVLWDEVEGRLVAPPPGEEAR